MGVLAQPSKRSVPWFRVDLSSGRLERSSLNSSGVWPNPRGLPSVSKGLPSDTLGFPCLVSCSMIGLSDGLTNSETSDTDRKTLPSTLEAHCCHVLFRGPCKNPVIYFENLGLLLTLNSAADAKLITPHCAPRVQGRALNAPSSGGPRRYFGHASGRLSPFS
jgi:hypothetical protein